MKFQVYFKHMDSSKALLEYAEAKLGERLDKYRLGLAEAHVTFAVESGLNCAVCHLTGADRFKVTVDCQDAVSMYAAVDRLAGKLDETLRRAKDRRRSHRVDGPIDLAPLTSTRLPPMDEDAIDAETIVATARISGGRQ